MGGGIRRKTVDAGHFAAKTIGFHSKSLELGANGAIDLGQIPAPSRSRLDKTQKGRDLRPFVRWTAPQSLSKTRPTQSWSPCGLSDLSAAFLATFGMENDPCPTLTITQERLARTGGIFFILQPPGRALWLPVPLSGP